MQPYKVYINQDVILSAPRSGVQRRRVMDFIYSLANNPHLPGDFSERDHVGRTVQVKVVGSYAVTYWPDHAVSEVKVTHVKPADQ